MAFLFACFYLLITDLIHRWLSKNTKKRKWHTRGRVGGEDRAIFKNVVYVKRILAHYRYPPGVFGGN